MTKRNILPEFVDLATDIIGERCLLIEYSVKKDEFKIEVRHPEPDLKNKPPGYVEARETEILGSPSEILSRTYKILSDNWRSQVPPELKDKDLREYYKFSNHDKGRGKESAYSSDRATHKETVHYWEIEVKRPHERKLYFREVLRVPKQDRWAKEFMALPLANALYLLVSEGSRQKDSLARIIDHCQYYVNGTNRKEVTGNAFRMSNFCNAYFPCNSSLTKELGEIENKGIRSIIENNSKGHFRSDLRWWFHEVYASMVFYRGLNSKDEIDFFALIEELKQRYRSSNIKLELLNKLQEILAT